MVLHVRVRLSHIFILRRPQELKTHFTWILYRIVELYHIFVFTFPSLPLFLPFHSHPFTPFYKGDHFMQAFFYDRFFPHFKTISKPSIEKAANGSDDENRLICQTINSKHFSKMEKVKELQTRGRQQIEQRRRSRK